MKKSKVFLISLCFVILFASFAEAQNARIPIRNQKELENLEKSNIEGCRNSTTTAKIPKPRDVVEFVRWMYRNISGKNVIVRVHQLCLPIIKEVKLSQTDITKKCSESNSSQDNQTLSNSNLIDVTTKAVDGNGDPLLYSYKVSGGQIISNGENKGSGAFVVNNGSNVTWDLSTVPPGVYTIIVGVDDGCGVCTEPVVKSIKITGCE